MITRVPIKNSSVEGSAKVKEIQCLKYDSCKQLGFVFFSIASVGIVLLITKWSSRFRRLMLFSHSNFEGATHFLIKFSDSSQNIVARFNGTNPLNKRPMTGFKCKLLLYIYDEHEQSFKVAERFIFPCIKENIIRDCSGGNSKEFAKELTDFFGRCEIQIPVPGLGEYLLNEMTKPFYILQYISMIVWILENIIIYTVVLLIVTVILVLLNFYFIRKSALKLKEMAHFKQKVQVSRGEGMITSDSTELAPGDAFIISNGMLVPCDCVLISGEVLMNECMLTGESVPILKTPIENNGELFDFNLQNKKSVLYEGTRVLQAKGPKNQGALAVVLRTGFCSVKGHLVRAILFPIHNPDKFYSQAIKFLVSYGIFSFACYFLMLQRMMSDNLGAKFYILRFFDVILWIIPPALQIYFAIPVTLSLIRLRKKGVLGLVPEKVNEAGKVTVCCFDKTGTLTETFIDMLGFHDVDPDLFPLRLGEFKNLELIASERDDLDRLRSKTLIFKLMATCHGVCIINGEKMGEELDMRMLEFSGWGIRASSDGDDGNLFKAWAPDHSYELNVKKVYEFESELQRMSVVVDDPCNEKSFYVFSKGAPEKIRSLCDPQTIPSNFNEALDEMTTLGYRILAAAYKKVPREEKSEASFQRDRVEKNLSFLGFLIMQNKLKSDTGQVIARLRAADISIKVISGDNALTTIQTAKEANIIPSHLPTTLCDVSGENGHIIVKKFTPISDLIAKGKKEDIPGRAEPNSELEMSCLNLIQGPSGTRLKDGTVVPLNSYNRKIESTYKIEERIINKDDISELGKLSSEFKSKNEVLAMTGPFLHILVDKKRGSVMHNQASTVAIFKAITENLVERCSVFARTKPEQKAQIVRELQNKGLHVAMVGDGANDCAALKQSNVGISFAQADASLTAPFSSDNQSIICVEKVLLEGRGLIITQVEVFKYLMENNCLRMTSVIILTFATAYFADMQFLYLNFFKVIPAYVFLGLTSPTNVLTRELPLYDMFSFYNVLSLYGQMILHTLTLVIAYVTMLKQDFYKADPTLVDGFYKTSCIETTTIYLAMNLILMPAAFVSVYSSPWKRKIFTNYVLSIWCLVHFIYDIVVMLKVEAAFGFLKLKETPSYFRRDCFFIVIGLSIVLWVFEDILVKKLLFRYLARRAMRAKTL